MNEPKQDDVAGLSGSGVERPVRPGDEAPTLVERLRRNADNWLPTNDHTLEAHTLLTEAAREIERLRATLALQQASYEREIALDVAEERERCAKLCESLEDSFSDSRRDPAEFAALIRRA
jgi:hypothetical protein